MRDWTLLDDERILALLGNGLTRSQIAAEFGVTRNMICGKIHRLMRKAPHMPDEYDKALVPNAETIAALEEADAGGGEVFHGTTEEAFAAILSSPKEDPRIRHRRIIIRKLRKALQSSTDEAFRERALWVIETKQSEINCLLAVADCHSHS